LRPAAAILAFTLAGGLQAEILDRTVAVVGSRPITASEVEGQALLEAMFNGVSPDLSDAARRTALERLVEQRLIESDMIPGALQTVAETDLDAAVEQLRGESFGGLAFTAALERYGVKEKDVRAFLRKQLRFTRYVRDRFRAGLQAEDEEVQAAYRRRFAGAPGAPAIADVREEIRDQLLNERSEAMLDERVRQLRAETQIVFLEPIEHSPEVAP
jgi:hypothetical protein